MNTAARLSARSQGNNAEDRGRTGSLVSLQALTNFNTDSFFQGISSWGPVSLAELVENSLKRKKPVKPPNLSYFSKPSMLMWMQKKADKPRRWS